MRSILSALTLLLILNSTYSQTTIEHSAAEHKGPVGDVVHSNNGNTINFFQHDYKQKYTLSNYATGESKTFKLDIIEDEHRGQIMHVSGEGDFIYEIVRFTKSSMAIKSRVGLIKRNISDFNKVGDVVYLNEFRKITTSYDSSIKMITSKNGINILFGREKGKDSTKCYFAKYDLDLNEIWKKDVNHLFEKGEEVVNWDVNDENNILVTLSVLPKRSNIWAPQINTSSLMLVNISPNGIINSFAPSTSSIIYILDAKFHYLSKTNEYVGIFLIPKAISDAPHCEGFGYTYYRWNNLGEVVHTTTNYFSIEDFKKDEIFNSYLARHPMSNNKILTLSRDLKTPYAINYKGPIFDFDEEGGAIVALNGYEIPLGMSARAEYVRNSKLLFSISPKGENRWLHFFPYHGIFSPNYMTNLVVDGKLHMFTAEYKENFIENNFELRKTTGLPSWKDVIPAVRVIDIETGEIESFNPIGTTQKGLKIAEAIPLKYYTGTNTILFKYIDYNNNSNYPIGLIKYKKYMYLEYNID